MHRGGESGEMGDKLRGIGALYFSLKRVNASQQLLLLVNSEAFAAREIRQDNSSCYWIVT